jgi:influenza virus NS1A-binding protein
VGSIVYRIDFQATEAYDTVTNIWSSKEVAPATLGQFFDIAVVDGKCYRFGGNSICHLVYDPQKDDGPGGQVAWSTVSQMPTPRASLAAVAFNGRIYCLGGNDGSGSVATTEIYDPATNTWDNGPTMLTARNTFAVGATENTIYVAGGLGTTWLSAAENLTGVKYFVHVKD